MRVLVTGMIVGLDSRTMLKRTVNYAKKVHGKDIEIIHFFDEAGFNTPNDVRQFLSRFDYVMEPIREATYAKIAIKLEKLGKKKPVIIRVPATIEWDDVNIKFKDHKRIKKYIKPDVIVTLIDAEWKVRYRLETEYPNNPLIPALKDRLRLHNFEEILDWMNEEVSLSEDWAEYLGIKHYVMSRDQPPESLYKLCVNPSIPSFYASYPMTHASKKDRQLINEVIDRLKKHVLIIDPQAIELGARLTPGPDKDASFAYTVHRDLHWDVKKTDGIVAIQPGSEPPYSWGMASEIFHAAMYGKKRWLLMKAGSPFALIHAVSPENIFPPDKVEDFFESFSKKYKELPEMRKKGAITPTMKWYKQPEES
ncbi:hypothetical protein KAW65_00025 [candidate division WOR-3 bacterium]|nr:hypothetical protein [candidate division WOR-3 bacterium]